jgi:hypothetical protein
VLFRVVSHTVSIDEIDIDRSDGTSIDFVLDLVSVGTCSLNFELSLKEKEIK